MPAREASTRALSRGKPSRPDARPQGNPAMAAPLPSLASGLLSYRYRSTSPKNPSFRHQIGPSILFHPTKQQTVAPPSSETAQTRPTKEQAASKSIGRMQIAHHHSTRSFLAGQAERAFLSFEIIPFLHGPLFKHLDSQAPKLIPS